MKSISRFLLLLAPAMLVLTACEQDMTDHGKAPASIGSITIDRTRIGTGQPVIAACPLPTGGENISKTEYMWQGNALARHTEADGKSTYAFTAPEKPGDYELTFTARYTFTGPDAEGNFTKDLTATKSYTVVACDALNSFWDDSVEDTLRNRPTLQKQDDNRYGGLFPDRLSGSTLNPPMIATLYTFTGGKLSEISEIESFENADPKAYTNKYGWISDRIGKLLGVALASQKVKWNDGTEETFDPNNSDPEYLNRIGQGIKDHKAEIVSVFKGSKTDMILEVFASEGKTTVEYMRTYAKAGTINFI